MEGPFAGPRLAAEDDAEREPSDLPGLPGWRRPVGGAPHPQGLREIVDAILKVTRTDIVVLTPGGVGKTDVGYDYSRWQRIGQGLNAHDDPRVSRASDARSMQTTD